MAQYLTEALRQFGRQLLSGTDGQRRQRHDRTPNFRRLLGEAAWQRLPAAVQARFAPAAHVGECIVYRGTMQVRASLPARWLAHLCRLIGTPVAPYEGIEVPVTVRVFDDALRGGTVWERRYDFPDRNPVAVRSTKCLDTDGSLLEALNAGLHMRLNLLEADGVLHFVSSGYFFRIGSLRVTLPGWFLPGVTHVSHRDLGGGQFEFEMTTRHLLLGELYFQRGVFT